MARYTGAVCRLCRRERMKLFLKGTKCDSMRCPIEKRPGSGKYDSPWADGCVCFGSYRGTGRRVDVPVQARAAILS